MCLFLIGVVLLQQGRSADLAGIEETPRTLTATLDEPGRAPAQLPGLAGSDNGADRVRAA